MYTVKKHDPGQWRKQNNPNLKGCDCSECKKFIDYMTEAYFHNVMRGLVLCVKCKGESPVIPKYSNNPREYNGIRYQSTLEAEYAAKLDLRVRANEIRSWKRQVEIPLNIKFVDNLPILTDEPELELKKQGIKFLHIANYFMDFIITHNDESLEYVETKGMELQPWQMKFILTQAILRDRAKLTVIKEQSYKKPKMNRKTIKQFEKNVGKNEPQKI
jgi:hypothetical protein